MTSQRLWKRALPQCQAALSPPSAGLPGKLIFRAQASTIVHTPILLSLTVGLCSHQPGFLFPRPGAQQCWKVRGEESIKNLGFLPALGSAFPGAVSTPCKDSLPHLRSPWLWNPSVTPSTTQPQELPCPIK